MGLIHPAGGCAGRPVGCWRRVFGADGDYEGLHCSPVPSRTRAPRVHFFMLRLTIPGGITPLRKVGKRHTVLHFRPTTCNIRPLDPTLYENSSYSHQSHRKDAYFGARRPDSILSPPAHGRIASGKYCGSWTMLPAPGIVAPVPGKSKGPPVGVGVGGERGSRPARGFGGPRTPARAVLSEQHAPESRRENRVSRIQAGSVDTPSGELIASPRCSLRER